MAPFPSLFLGLLQDASLVMLRRVTKTMINELGKVFKEAVVVENYSLLSRRTEKTTCTQLANSKRRPHNMHVDGCKRNIT